MRDIRKNIKSITLASLVMFSVGVQSLGMFIRTASAAPPDSITITNSLGSADCVAQLGIENTAYIPSTLLDAMSSSSDLSMVDDYNSIINAQGNGQAIIYIHFVPVNAGNGTNNGICDDGNMASRPSDPKTFLSPPSSGSNVSIGIVPAILNATAATLTFAGPSHSSGVVLKVVNSPNSPGALTNPAFTSGGGQAGFCSAAAAIQGGGGPAVFTACMEVNVDDFSNMTYRGETYTLESWRGDDMHYYLSATPYASRKFFLTQAKGSCVPELQIGTGNDNSNGPEYDINVDNVEQGEFNSAMDHLSAPPTDPIIGYTDYSPTCVSTGQKDVTAHSFSNMHLMFQVFPKEKNIVFITNNPGGNEKKFITGTFVQDADNPLIFRAPPQNSNCSSKDVVPRIELSAAPVETDGAGPIPATWFFTTNASSCTNGDVHSASVLVKQTAGSSAQTSATLGAQTGTTPPAEGDTTDTPAPITCNTTWKNAISWILCPIIGLAEDLVDKIQELVAGFLFVDTAQFNSANCGGPGTNGACGLYNAWNSIRQISTVIIVIIALIMIFSEAMGAGIMNNYSVKKILPRLVFAGIAIQLSWVFAKELINVSNIFGNGIQGLLLAPFGGTVGTDLLTLIDPTKLSGGSSVGLFAALVGGAVSIGAIGSIAIGLIIALIIAFITLILRYMVIILCVLFAPIAIALSVLPGTQKLSKLWWESFSKALAMYPVIMAMFAAGKIVAFGLMQAGKDPQTGKQDGWFTLAAIVAYFLPYGLLPAALKAGGSALNKVSGAFTDKSKGTFDKVRGYNERRQKFKDQLKQEKRAVRAGDGKGISRIDPRAMYARNRIRSAQGANMLGGIPFLKTKTKSRYANNLASVNAAAQKKAVDEAFAQIGTITDAAKLKDIATSRTSSSAQRQAAVQQLIALRKVKELADVHADSRGKRAIDDATSNTGGQFSAVREIAPHLLTDATDHTSEAFRGKKDSAGVHVATNIASAEAMTKWNAETWKLAFQSGNPEITARATQILGDSQLSRTLTGDVLNLLNSPPPPLPPPSDIRLKRNITFVGEQNSHKLYSYQYTWSNTYYVDVMAQDLLETHPEAVSVDSFGYYHVGYSRLGLELKTLYEWQKTNKLDTKSR